MSAQTLPSQFKPIIGASGTNTYSLRKVQFSDGYAHISKNGINNIQRTFNLTFQGLKTTDKNTLITFLDGQAGDIINWTPPGESTPVSFFCESVNITTLGGDRWTVTCTFERLYGNFA